jgi:hypothetical protein
MISNPYCEEDLLVYFKEKNKHLSLLIEVFDLDTDFTKQIVVDNEHIREFSKTRKGWNEKRNHSE